MRDLKHPDRRVRRDLVRHLFYSNDPRAPALLSRMANGDGDGHLRFLARKAIHLLERRAALAPGSGGRASVHQRLRAPDARLRQSAVRELARLRERDAYDVLVTMLPVETDPFVRTAIVRSLPRLGGPRAIPVLRELLSDPSNRVRAAAIDGLAEIGHAGTCRDTVAMLCDPDPRVADAARRAALAFGFDRLLAALSELAAAPSPVLRLTAVRVMEHLRVPRMAALLAAATADADAQVRAAAVAATAAEEAVAASPAGERGERPSGAHLARPHEEAAPTARERSERPSGTDFQRPLPEASPTSGLASPGLPAALAALRDLPAAVAEADPLDSADRDARLEEVHEIVTHRLLSRIPKLGERARGEPDPAVRATLVMALGILKAREWSDLMLEGLKDPDERVRANAVEALGMLEDPHVLKSLIPLVKDPAPRVRANAIIALKRTRGVDLVGPLQEMVERGDARAAASAIFAITDLGTSETTLLLKPLLGSPQPELRARAVEALEIMRRTGNMVAGALLAEHSQGGNAVGAGLDFSAQEWEEPLD
jgi:HEAT repeat protein